MENVITCILNVNVQLLGTINVLCLMSYHYNNKDPEWPSGLVPARHAGAPGSLPGRVGLSEINFSDLYCGWLGRIINVEYNTTHNTIYWGAVVWGYVRCLAAGGLRVRIHLKSRRVGTLGKSFTRNCS